MKKNNLLNKNILKKFMGAFLASVMTFGSAGQLITLASPISVQKLPKDTWNNGNYFKKNEDITGKIEVLNILLNSIGKEEISEEENKEDKIFQKVENALFDINFENKDVEDIFKNIKEISPHAILEHNYKYSNYKNNKNNDNNDNSKKTNQTNNGKKTLFKQDITTKVLLESIVKVEKNAVYIKNPSKENDSKSKMYLPSEENSDDIEYEYICETKVDVGNNLKKLLIVTAPIRDNDGNMTGSEKIITMYPISEEKSIKSKNLSKLKPYHDILSKYKYSLVTYCNKIDNKIDKREDLNEISKKRLKGSTQSFINILNLIHKCYTKGLNKDEASNEEKINKIENFFKFGALQRYFKTMCVDTDEINKNTPLEDLIKFFKDTFEKLANNDNDEFDKVVNKCNNPFENTGKKQKNKTPKKSNKKNLQEQNIVNKQ